MNSYDVFGEPIIRDSCDVPRDSSAYGNSRMFTGREYDSETGNYYYRARYYSPGIGRFLQADPIGYAAGLNLYAYCNNNPLNWIDPFGFLRGPDHEYITRRAMKKAGFSDSDINKAVKANRDVDRLSNQFNKPAHYMPGSGSEAEDLKKEQLQKARKSRDSGKTDEAMEELGEGLHTVQDKPSHKDKGSWPNHLKGLLPFVPSPDDNWGTPADNAYKDTTDYIKKYLEKSPKK